MSPSDPPVQPARLRQVLIDDAAWESLEAARRRDVLAAIDNLKADGRFEVPGRARLRLLVESGRERIVLGLAQVDGHLLVQAAVPLDGLAARMREYVDTCRRLADGAAGHDAGRLEALDIAKRLIHDEGAAELAGLCSLLRPDHNTARKLFTLIVTLRHDTARLRPVD